MERYTIFLAPEVQKVVATLFRESTKYDGEDQIIWDKDKSLPVSYLFACLLAEEAVEQVSDMMVSFTNHLFLYERVSREVVEEIGKRKGRVLLEKVQVPADSRFSILFLIYLLSPTYEGYKHYMKTYLQNRPDGILEDLMPMIHTMVQREDVHYMDALYESFQSGSSYIYLIHHQLFTILKTVENIQSIVPFMRIAYAKSGFDYRIQMHHLFITTFQSSDPMCVKINEYEYTRTFYEDILEYPFQGENVEDVIILFDLGVLTISPSRINAYDRPKSSKLFYYVHDKLKFLCERSPDLVAEVVCRDSYYEKYMQVVMMHGLYDVLQKILHEKIREDRSMHQNQISFDIFYLLLKTKKGTFSKSNMEEGYKILAEEVIKSTILPKLLSESQWIEIHTCLLRMCDSEDSIHIHSGGIIIKRGEVRLIQWNQKMRESGMGKDLFRRHMTHYFYLENGYYRALQEGLESLDRDLEIPVYHTLLTGALYKSIPMHFLEYLLQRPELRRLNLFNALVVLPPKCYQDLYGHPRIEEIMRSSLRNESMVPSYTLHCFFCNNHFDPSRNTKGYICEECEYMAHDTCLFRIFSEIGTKDSIKVCQLCKKKTIKRNRSTYEERKRAFYFYFLERVF